MIIVEIRKIEDCFDGSRVYGYRFDEPWARDAIERLGSLGWLKIHGPLEPAARGGLVSFVDPEIHPHDLAQVLDMRGIAVRAGHHCAQPLLRLLGEVATARASFAIYNDRDDVDALVEGLREARRYFGLL